MGITINSFEVENVKRVRAVKCSPSQKGLTVIGGKNGQGKTSVLDSIVWALGGDKYKPSAPNNSESSGNASIHLELSNGLVIERAGKNGSLKVTDPSGMKGGQALLDSLIGKLALDLPKFLAADGKEKANILLQIIGVEDKLTHIERQVKKAYDERRTVGQIASQKKKYADELPEHKDAPEKPVSISELIQKQKEIVALNAGKEDLRRQKAILEREICDRIEDIKTLELQIEAAKKLNAIAKKELAKIPDPGEDIPTDKIEENIANAETINQQVRDNATKKAAMAESKQYETKYNDLSAALDKLAKAKLDLLNDAAMPLNGLSVDDGELIYNGQKWDCMSSSDQLKVAVAIVRKLKPDCGFVLMDKLEQMDMDTLAEFGYWLESEDLQVIATRVSTGEECSIIIEDGAVKETK